MKSAVSVIGHSLISVLGFLALLLCFGCSTADPGQPRSLPPSILGELSSRSSPPEALGFQVDRTGQIIVRGPRTGYSAASNFVSLPFTLDRGWPAVEARLNEIIVALVVVDTGASVTSLAGRTAASARVRTIDTNYFPAQLVRGVGGTERTVIGLIDRLSLGGLDVTNLAVNVRLEETPGSRKAFGRGPRIDNLLGLSPVLAGSSFVTVDYPQKMITFSPRGEFPTPVARAGMRAPLQVPFELSREGLQILLGFPNGRRAPFVVDTGYSGELLMSTSTTQIVGAGDAVREGRQGAVRGIGGEMMQIGFTMDWVEVSGRRFGYVKASTGTEHDLLGSGWLRQFRVTFDFKRRIMWLE